jgi:DNA-binding NtrC family response regulator
MAITIASASGAAAKPAVARDVHILIIDNDEALLGALWHALDSEGWQIRATAAVDQVLPALASAEWTVVIVNVAITGLSGPVFDTLQELALAPAVAEGRRRARILFLVPEELSFEAHPMLEGLRLPHTSKPINLHDLLEKVSDLMLEAQAIAAPIRRVRDLRRKPAPSRCFGARAASMFAERADYTLTEEELGEFDRAEAASRVVSPAEKKKNVKDLGAPLD